MAATASQSQGMARLPLLFGRLTVQAMSDNIRNAIKTGNGTPSLRSRTMPAVAASATGTSGERQSGSAASRDNSVVGDGTTATDGGLTALAMSGASPG